MLKNDLKKNNIPIFFCDSHQDCIYNSQGEALSLKVKLSPLNHAKYNLANYWSEDDLNLQISIINNSLEAYAFNNLFSKISDMACVTHPSWTYFD